MKVLVEEVGDEYDRKNMRFALLEYWSMRTQKTMYSSASPIGRTSLALGRWDTTRTGRLISGDLACESGNAPGICCPRP